MMTMMMMMMNSCLSVRVGSGQIGLGVGRVLYVASLSRCRPYCLFSVLLVVHDDDGDDDDDVHYCWHYLLPFPGLSDPDAKRKYIVSLLSSLPEPNKSTMSYVIDHILRSVYRVVQKK